MSLFIEQPPLDMSDDTKRYVITMLRNIDIAIDAATRIKEVQAVPSLPQSARIYYLREDLSEEAVQSYYVWMDNPADTVNRGVWERLVLGSQYKELEERVAALEAL